MTHSNRLFIISSLLFLSCNTTKHSATFTVENESNTIQKSIEEKAAEVEAPSLESQKEQLIINLISAFKSKNVSQIADKINYPLQRIYPVPEIKSKADFLQRFDTLFDTEILEQLSASTPEQWTEVGWRGFMFMSGEVWMDATDGKITAINHQSKAETKWKDELIALEKEKLHSSLKTFTHPVYRIETENYLIRIDEMSNYTYRYASWKKGVDESVKPDLLLLNGDLQIDGSGGNHELIFKNGKYTYTIYRFVIGDSDTPEVLLEVSKDNHLVVSEPGKLLLND